MPSHLLRLALAAAFVCGCPSVASEPRDRLSYVTNLVWPGRGGLATQAVAALREFGLEPDLHRRPEDLPFGRRRLVAIARAVAARPSILLLDEPAAGLDDTETAELGRLAGEQEPQAEDRGDEPSTASPTTVLGRSNAQDGRTDFGHGDPRSGSTTCRGRVAR